MTTLLWENLLLPGVVPHEDAQTFHVSAIHDPAYRTPWLLATPLTLRPITLKAIDADRWPVEQIPLSAKQMLGAHRQFVHAAESIQRLPELALWVGSILSFLAATFPVCPRAFGTKLPSAPQVVFGASSAANLFRNLTLCPSNSEKRTPSRLTCPKAWPRSVPESLGSHNHLLCHQTCRTPASFSGN